MDPRDPSFEAVLGESAWLRALARSLVKDVHRAEDAVQETLAKALERPGEARSSLRGWLGTVLRNQLHQEKRAEVRRRGREERASSNRPEPPAGETAERLELQALLLEAVRALDEPYRTAIVQRYLDGLPPREIARRANLPVKTVHTRIERGLKTLRARLDARFGGERSAWVQVLLPLAAKPAFPWLPSAETIALSTPVKLAAGVAALATAGWLGSEALRSPTQAPAAPIVALSSSSDTPEESAFSESANSVLVPAHERTAAGPELAATQSSARPPMEPAASTSETAPVDGSAALDVRIVRSPEGTPLVGARVSIKVLEGKTEAGGRLRETWLAASDDGGFVRALVPAGQSLWVTADPGGNPFDPVQRATLEVEPLAPAEARSVALELVHGHDRIFHGQVVAAEDGRPLAGALVARAPWESPGPRVETDAAGFFAFPYASWDPREVDVRHAGYGMRCLRLGWLDQTPREPYRVALERAASIAAEIATAGARVELELRATCDGSVWASVLDERGRGALEELPARRPVQVELRQSDALVWRTSEPWTLEPGERRALELELGTGTFVEGFLRDQDGRPADGHEVWALAEPKDENVEGRFRFFEPQDGRAAHVATCDGHGRFELGLLPSGKWWIGPGVRGDDDHALAAHATGVELRAGELARRLDLCSTRDLSIRGRVIGPEGVPLESGHVTATRDPDQGRVVADLGEGGEFLVGPLVPGTYELGAYADGVMGWNRPERAEAGADDVVIALARAHSIAGRVVDADGRPADAHVHLLQRGGSLGQGTSRQEQGAFLFLELRPGTYSAKAETPDGRVVVREVVLEAGGRITGLVLELGDGARIGIRHDLEDDARCTIWSGGVVVVDSTVRAGEESFEVVPAGPVKVELYDGHGTLSVQEFEARAGRVESVVFDL